jgi:hypothetical protein
VPLIAASASRADASSGGAAERTPEGNGVIS